MGGSEPARSAPPVRPSAQPFSPRPRSTEGAHIKQSGTQAAQGAAGNPSTNARPKDMPMKQREPGEPGRPGGRARSGSAPDPVSKLRVPGFHTAAQTPRTPEQRAT